MTARTRPGLARLALLAGVLAVLAALVLGGTAEAKTAPKTAVSYVNPISTSTHLIGKGYSVGSSRSGGDCQGSNIFEGAGRCFSGNYIYDPCWPFRYKNSDFSGFACLAAPWQHRLTVLKKAGWSDAPSSRGHGLWGFQIATGGRCSLMTGAGDQYHGQAVDWGCDNGLYGLGYPTHRSGVWYVKTVRYRKNYSIYSTGTRRISRLWIGYGYGGR